VIRINLLPVSARRRRRGPARERLALAAMIVGWAALVSAGAAWNAAADAEAAALRDLARARDDERAAVERAHDPAGQQRRQAELAERTQALEQLAAARGTPAAALAAVAGVVAGGGSPLQPRPEAAAWLTQVRALGGGRWALAGSARDVAALTELVRGLRASGRVAGVGAPEYARGAAGRLEFRLELTARD
jgi:Tfp pilus assembly protein PilN